MANPGRLVIMTVLLIGGMMSATASEAKADERIGPEPGAESTFGEAFFTATPFTIDTERGLQLGTINRHSKNKHGRMSVRGKAVEILLPKRFDAAKHYRVVYLLSACGRLDVEALQVIQELDLHNTLDVICVLPEMGGWYGEHPTDTTRRKQSYLREVVVPLIESRYPTVPGKEGRLLLGFSKSGWGAFSLIFCNPDFFGYAASWDAPLSWGLDKMHSLCRKHYASIESYRHHHPMVAAERSAAHFTDRTRLVHSQGRAWGKHAEPYHQHLDTLGIEHVYQTEHRPKHRWDGEWVGPAMEALVTLANKEQP